MGVVHRLPGGHLIPAPDHSPGGSSQGRGGWSPVGTPHLSHYRTVYPSGIPADLPDPPGPGCPPSPACRLILLSRGRSSPGHHLPPHTPLSRALKVPPGLLSV